MGYNEGGSGWKIILFIIMLIIIGGFVFWLYGDRWQKTQKLHNTIFTKVNNLQTNTKVQVDGTWCIAQEVMVLVDIEKPSRDRILGWDAVENCCVREIQGFNCALNRTSTMQYCFTSNLGGEVLYIKIDDFFADQTRHRDFISDYDKEYIFNKPCDNSKYPGGVI